MKAKTTSKKSVKVRDLAPRPHSARKVKGGAINVCKTPTPSGPVPVPYPN